MSNNEQMFYNQQDVAGGIMFYHNNATMDDFNNKCAELGIADLTWRCFGKDCIFFYKRHEEDDEEDDEEEEEDD